MGRVSVDSETNDKRDRVYLIACGVLRPDVERTAEDLCIDLETEYLEGGLHNVPKELLKRVQEAIGKADSLKVYDRIAIGYGICGRGTIGLTAEHTPLVIPRVHDCISLFLGSDAAYKNEFSGKPGTYYISAGWFEEQVQPKGTGNSEFIRSDESITGMKREELEGKYGKESADNIIEFLSTWKKNYNRAAFIDTGAGTPETYESYAKALSEEFGWEYTSLQGDRTLLRDLLTVVETNRRILFVPPGSVTRFDPKEGKISSAPRWKQDKSHSDAREDIVSDIPRESSSPAPRQRRYGLGIDAGGTYTDAVIYDFHTKEVVCSGKALTTKWDFTIGIGNAIDRFKGEHVSRVDIVSVSTTLATNAIVENHGQKVGLIVMPGSSCDPADIAYRPIKVIRGSLDISGKELESLDEQEIRKAASDLVKKEGVNVFAVSGYAGSVNPAHEIRVKEIIMKETGLHVCCGHELSELYNFQVRANTAVLNAKIIPLLEKFLEDVEKSLSHRGIQAPVMVVKGDGTLMSSQIARERPIETILSGPAASIAGAKYLTDLTDSIVIDIGGTTSDIGSIKEGGVEVKGSGAKVGGWRTHVRALDMSTVGLGGDSEIVIEKQELIIGPRRIAPISWLGSEYSIQEALDFVERNLDSFITNAEPIQFLLNTGSGEHLDLTRDEEKILKALSDGPCSLLELADRTGAGYWLMLRTKRLEEHYIIQRCGMTPTDIFHIQKKLSMWNRDAAMSMAAVMSTRAGISIEDLITRVNRLNTRKLIGELIKKQMPGETESFDTCDTCQAMLNAVYGENDNFEVKINLRHPVIGLGAPAKFFLMPVSRLIKAEILIPEYAEVANAVGAITSSVLVKKQLSIVPTSDGKYTVIGLPGHFTAESFDDAQEYASEELNKQLLQLAESSGTSERRVRIRIEDRIAKAANGTEVFLECTLSGEIEGTPDSVVPA